MMLTSYYCLWSDDWSKFQSLLSLSSSWLPAWFPQVSVTIMIISDLISFKIANEISRILSAEWVSIVSIFWRLWCISFGVWPSGCDCCLYAANMTPSTVTSNPVGKIKMSAAEKAQVVARPKEIQSWKPQTFLFLCLRIWMDYIHYLSLMIFKLYVVEMISLVLMIHISHNDFSLWMI